MGSDTTKPQPNTIKNTKSGTTDGVTFAGTSMKGWRTYNQDTYIISTALNGHSDKHLFCIFDGHGGAQVAIIAERHFVEILKLNTSFLQEKYEQALIETFIKIDELIQNQKGIQEIIEIRKQFTQDNNGLDLYGDIVSGCTAIAILITANSIITANLGDCRAVACSKQTKTIQLSYDHKPQNQQQTKRIVNAGGRVHNGRINGDINISRSIGDLHYKCNLNLGVGQQMISIIPDVKVTPREGIKFILMGCDGVWQRKSSKQMVEWVMQQIQLGKDSIYIVERLLNTELGKYEDVKGKDNMTAIIIKLN